MKDYYYIDGQNKQQGPVAGDTLLDKGVTSNTYVWCVGMGNQWAHAGDVYELKSLFAPVPPVFPGNSGQQQDSHPGPQPGVFPGSQPGPQPGQPEYTPQQTGYTPQQPGYTTQQPGPDYSQKPDNYLVWSILVTLLCCLIGGIVAIVYSSKVDSHWNAGRYDEAIKASTNAKNWCIGSAIVGLIFSVIYCIALVANM